MVSPKNPFEQARRGDVEYFEGLELDIIENSREGYEGPVLYRDVMSGHLKCCEVIYRRCPQLLYETTNGGNTVLHNAAWNGSEEIIKFLLTAKAKLEQDVKGAQSAGGKDVVDYKLLTMLASGDDTALHHAAYRGHSRSAKVLIEADPSKKLLRMASTDNRTAMHVAVRNRQSEIVEMLVEADPIFEYSTDSNGNTPLLIALEEGFSGEQKAGEIRTLLSQKQPKQCNIGIGKMEWTIIHHATVKGDSNDIK